MKVMKGIVGITLVGLLIFGMVGCGSGNSQAKETLNELSEFSEAGVLETLVEQQHSPEYLQTLVEKLNEDGDYDKDGIKDYEEIRQGTNPLEPNSIESSSVSSSAVSTETPTKTETTTMTETDSSTTTPKNSSSATVTVTVTVAPGRLLVVDEGGKIIQVFSNFTTEYEIPIENYVLFADWEKNKELGPDEYVLTVNDMDGNKIPPTEDVLNQYFALAIEYDKIGEVYKAY
jgi:hypothetical protein